MSCDGLGQTNVPGLRIAFTLKLPSSALQCSQSAQSQHPALNAICMHDMAHLPMRPMHSAILRATPPGSCLTVPGTVPPGWSGQPARAFACRRWQHLLKSKCGFLRADRLAKEGSYVQVEHCSTQNDHRSLHGGTPLSSKALFFGSPLCNQLLFSNFKI